LVFTFQSYQSAKESLAGSQEKLRRRSAEEEDAGGVLEQMCLQFGEGAAETLEAQASYTAAMSGKLEAMGEVHRANGRVASLS
jgi:hypothetical protein